jgi:hypothetical protein
MSAKIEKTFDLSSLDSELQDVMMQSSPKKLPSYINGFCERHNVYEDCGCGRFRIYCGSHLTYFSSNTYGCRYCVMGVVDPIKLMISQKTKWPMPFIIELDGQYFFGNATNEMHIIGTHYYKNHTNDEIDKYIEQKKNAIHRRMLGMCDIDSFVDEFDKKLTVDDDKEFNEFVDDFIQQLDFTDKPFYEEEKKGDDDDLLDFSERPEEEEGISDNNIKKTYTTQSECRICLFEYDSENHRPLIFECGHTFCRTCVHKSTHNNTALCSMCRYVQIVEKDMINLKTNYDLIVDF